jgi:hypothetical protein
MMVTKTKKQKNKKQKTKNKKQKTKKFFYLTTSKPTLIHKIEMLLQLYFSTISLATIIDLTMEIINIPHKPSYYNLERYSSFEIKNTNDFSKVLESIINQSHVAVIEEDQDLSLITLDVGDQMTITIRLWEDNGEHICEVIRLLGNRYEFYNFFRKLKSKCTNTQ